jgi:hypothetical protein
VLWQHSLFSELVMWIARAWTGFSRGEIERGCATSAEATDGIILAGMDGRFGNRSLHGARRDHLPDESNPGRGGKNLRQHCVVWVDSKVFPTLCLVDTRRDVAARRLGSNLLASSAAESKMYILTFKTPNTSCDDSNPSNSFTKWQPIVGRRENHECYSASGGE